MPSLDEILIEMSSTPSPLDIIRKKYIKELNDYTNRETIVYFSGFLNNCTTNVDINDSDMNGFMNVLYGMETSKGLDLLLHTPGGSPTAAESIVNYLRKFFDENIRVIVPHLAMSAGTMIACSAKDIIMGKQSSLGPIDPQINGVPAYNIIREFEEAKNDLNKGINVLYWKIRLSNYPQSFIYFCQNAISLSEKLTREWLSTGMFKGKPEEQVKIDKILSALNENEQSLNHGRHFNADFCKKLGLNIVNLEDDDKFQDLVLSIYHAETLTISNTNCSKIIETANKQYTCIQK